MDDLKSDERVRLRTYASELLEGVVFNFQQGFDMEAVSESLDDEDDPSALNLRLNPFELYAHVIGEKGFNFSVQSDDLTEAVLRLKQLSLDAEGWYYVPLGENSLEFVDLESWSLLYRNWLTHRRSRAKHKNTSKSKTHN